MDYVLCIYIYALHIKYVNDGLASTRTEKKSEKKNYFASSDPHHDISKQLVDTTFVWSFCHGTFAQLTIPIICFTWQVIVHVRLSNRI